MPASIPDPPFTSAARRDADGPAALLDALAGLAQALADRDASRIIAPHDDRPTPRRPPAPFAAGESATRAGPPSNTAADSHAQPFSAPRDDEPLAALREIARHAAEIHAALSRFEARHPPALFSDPATS